MPITPRPQRPERICPASTPKWLILLLLWPLLACSPSPPSADTINLIRLSQRPGDYVVPGQASDPLLSPQQQEILRSRLQKNVLAPWQEDFSGQPQAKLFWALEQAGPWYGVNGLPYGDSWWHNARQQCRTESFPDDSSCGITLSEASLRALPTRQPAFKTPGDFPFDQLQHSRIGANVPLRIRHHSRDGAWLLVETTHLFGWLPANQVAKISPDDRRLLQQAPLAVVVQDHTVLQTEGRHVLTEAQLGDLLFYATQQPAGERILVAQADVSGIARLTRCPVDSNRIRPFPLPLTAAAVAALAESLMGDAYDWGGQYGRRDCSALTGDLLRPFGLDLPRNSGEQIQDDIALPLPPGQQEPFIRRHGTPFTTLIGWPGHVMLYLGQNEGEAVVLHSLWSLRTGSCGQRYPIGKVVITSLRPGREWPGLFPPELSLLARCTRLRFLTTPSTLPGEKE
ncbi:MAG: SH3 domain-containing protein [Desulfuromonadaceae bacterium]|nr:SH3 domain-containing protein [Desulfuromonadaceae bacterium]